MENRLTTLLIDGDIIAFTVAARVEQKIDWGDDVRTRSANFDQAKFEVGKWMDELMQTLKADKAIICLSDPSRRYFRHTIFPAYKISRTHGETPLLLTQVKEHLRDGHYQWKSKPGLEADDVMGILATVESDDERIIVTADKDLDQIPGLHYNPRKVDGLKLIEPWMADYNFWTQALTGDPTDEFPGCRGIGPKRAAKILGEALENHDNDDDLHIHVWEYIMSAYAAKGFNEDFALTQARVARILRASDYDFTKAKPILWTPTQPSH